MRTTITPSWLSAALPHPPPLTPTPCNAGPRVLLVFGTIGFSPLGTARFHGRAQVLVIIGT